MGKGLDKLLAVVDRETNKITINALDGSEDKFDIYYTPITLAEQKKILRQSKGNDVETIVYTVIIKSLDEAGDPLFDIGDKQRLMREVPSDVLSDIVIKMGLGESEDEADPVKN